MSDLALKRVLENIPDIIGLLVKTVGKLRNNNEGNC